jgi:hypothetical protein
MDFVFILLALWFITIDKPKGFWYKDAGLMTHTRSASVGRPVDRVEEKRRRHA